MDAASLEGVGNILAHVGVDTTLAVGLGKLLDMYFPRLCLPSSGNRDEMSLPCVLAETLAQVAVLALISRQVGSLLGNKEDPTAGLAFTVPAYLSSPILVENFAVLSKRIGELVKSNGTK